MDETVRDFLDFSTRPINHVGFRVVLERVDQVILLETGTELGLLWRERLHRNELSIVLLDLLIESEILAVGVDDVLQCFERLRRFWELDCFPER